MGWIKCFLTKHSEKVVFEGISSEEVGPHFIRSTTGDSPGSSSSLNDIETNIDSQICLFADD